MKKITATRDIIVKLFTGDRAHIVCDPRDPRKNKVTTFWNSFGNFLKMN